MKDRLIKHTHPMSQTEADGMPNIIKQGENTYLCSHCNKILVLTR